MIPRYRAYHKKYGMREVMSKVWTTRGLYVHLKLGNNAPVRTKVAKLMQSTGMKDKNGKEIFEGDILLARYDFEEIDGKLETSYEKSVVEIKDFAFQVKVIGLNSYILLSDLDIKGENVEIIGNIYEDKELMKVEG